MIICKPHQFLDIVAPYLPVNPVIIEAGAFNGSDTIKLAKKWPQATIHAFEPVPAIYQKLVTATKEYPTIHTYQIALSDNIGTAIFYVSEKPEKPGVPSQAGSLLAPKERLNYSSMQFPSTIEVPTITLDAWAQKEKVDHIDFAWLDMQGTELAVLQASPEMLKTIKTIVCEVGFKENYAGQPSYQQITDFLTQHGFEIIARDFENMSSWFFGNILVVRK